MQRRVEAHDSLDDFPTPPWGTRALCEKLLGVYPDLEKMTVWEPAANRGYMARSLREYFADVAASDIHDYGVGFGVADFLWPTDPSVPPFDWIITNPPFRLAEQFIYTARQRATKGAAVLCRSAFSEGIDRYEKMFSINPPSFVWQFVERLPMVRGGVDSDVSSATAYAWFVWIRDRTGPTVFDWLAPCRKKLERPTDYDA